MGIAAAGKDSGTAAAGSEGAAGKDSGAAEASSEDTAGKDSGTAEAGSETAAGEDSGTAEAGSEGAADAVGKETGVSAAQESGVGGMGGKARATTLPAAGSTTAAVEVAPAGGTTPPVRVVCTGLGVTAGLRRASAVLRNERGPTKRGRISSFSWLRERPHWRRWCSKRATR